MMKTTPTISTNDKIIDMIMSRNEDPRSGVIRSDKLTDLVIKIADETGLQLVEPQVAILSDIILSDLSHIDICIRGFFGKCAFCEVCAQLETKVPVVWESWCKINKTDEVTYPALSPIVPDSPVKQIDQSNLVSPSSVTHLTFGVNVCKPDESSPVTPSSVTHLTFGPTVCKPDDSTCPVLNKDFAAEAKSESVLSQECKHEIKCDNEMNCKMDRNYREHYSRFDTELSKSIFAVYKKTKYDADLLMLDMNDFNDEIALRGQCLSGDFDHFEEKFCEWFENIVRIDQKLAIVQLQQFQEQFVIIREREIRRLFATQIKDMVKQCASDLASYNELLAMRANSKKQ